VDYQHVKRIEYEPIVGKPTAPSPDRLFAPAVHTTPATAGLAKRE
jgi:hypothetical protein